MSEQAKVLESAVCEIEIALKLLDNVTAHDSGSDDLGSAEIMLTRLLDTLTAALSAPAQVGEAVACTVAGYRWQSSNVEVSFKNSLPAWLNNKLGMRVYLTATPPAPSAADDAEWRQQVCNKLGMDTGAGTAWSPGDVFHHVCELERRAAYAVVPAGHHQAIRFGQGGVAVSTGTQNGGPAVFLREPPEPGIVGAELPHDYEEMPLRVAMLFPTAEQAKAVANALVPTPTEDKGRTWPDDVGKLHPSLVVVNDAANDARHRGDYKLANTLVRARVDLAAALAAAAPPAHTQPVGGECPSLLLSDLRASMVANISAIDEALAEYQPAPSIEEVEDLRLALGEVAVRVMADARMVKICRLIDEHLARRQPAK